MSYDDFNKREPRLEVKYGITKAISFDVHDNWYDIVDAALEALSKLPEWHPDKIAQVKEKFWQLRIYLNDDLNNEQAFEIVRQAEVAASNINIK